MRAACVAVVVDHVPTERIDDLVADLFGGRGTRLGELAGDPTQLHHRHTRAVGQHDCHLQDDLELVADGVGAEFGERFGAVTRLEDERPAVGGLSQSPGQVSGLTGKYQGGKAGQPGVDPLELVLVGPLRLLRGRLDLHESGAQDLGGRAGTAPA